MPVLAFDCCLRSLSVAVLAGERITAHQEPCESGQAEKLMPLIERVLADANVAYKDLSRLAVRVGIAAARGLALAIGIPVVGQSSLAALAQAALEPRPTRAQRLIAVIPAGRGGIYWQTFDAATAAELEPACVVEAEQLAAQSILPGDFLVGPGATEVAAALQAAGLASPSTRPDVVPRADIFARSAKHLTPVSELRPIYLRAADARPQTGKALARA
jgi:tRNA threonylcarbamoyladenosine biosynthesis protein TsaB